MNEDGSPNSPMVSTGRRTAILIAAGMTQFLVTVDYWSAAIAMPPTMTDMRVAAERAPQGAVSRRL